MNGLIARATAQIEFIWQTKYLHGSRTDGAISPSMVGGVTRVHSPVNSQSQCQLSVLNAELRYYNVGALAKMIARTRLEARAVQ